MTDKGQTEKSTEDDLTKQLSNIAPPVNGLAEATNIAPECKALSANSELGDQIVASPSVIVSADPQSPPTLIPATDSSTTRPTKGGIAYPFSLKVGCAAGEDANASTLTLQSMTITTPPAVDAPHQDKELGTFFPVTETINDQILKERPAVERYFTAPGAGLFSDGTAQTATSSEEKTERPPVERFETAQEDLSTLANATYKAK